ncbi:MAG: alpha-2-macroglobulin family protein [Crocinitomicaceae bacterium]
MKKINILLGFFSILLSAVSNAQNFPPIDSKIKFAQHDFKLVNQYKEDGLPNKAVGELIKIQERAIQEKNLFNFQQSTERLLEMTTQGGMEANEIQQLFFTQHQLLTKTTGAILNLLALNLNEHCNFWQFRNNFSFDDESLEWSINGKPTRLKNQDISPLSNEYKRVLLKNETDLMRIAANQIFDTNELEYQPTLYDVLANYYLESFGYDEIVEACHWESTFDFSQDTLSVNQRIYANLEQLHKTNQRWDAYAFWLERRLKNCDQSELTNENLLPVFLKFQNELKGFPASNRFAYRRAEMYAEQGNSYDWHNSEMHKNDFNKAIEIIDQALTEHAKSEFGDELEDLKKRILEPSLQLEFTNQLRPAERNFMAVNYRNLTSANFVVFEIEKRLDELANNQNPLKNLKLKEISNTTLNFENDDNHLRHNKDFLLEELSETGQYLVMAAATRSDWENALKAEKLYEVPNIAYEVLSLSNLVMRHSREKDGIRLIINDIQSGKPIKGAKVVVEKAEYGNNPIYLKELKTDENGSVKLAEGRRFKVTVYHKNDSISDFIYFYPEGQKEINQVRVFTDRSIYRPGQIVHFKTLWYDEKEKGYEVLGGKKSKIVFKDNNDQILYEYEATTNEFGSIGGSFGLPKSGFPLGNVAIYMDGKYVDNLQVEEYKRPTFEVSFDTPKEKVALGETVKMQGKVMAYAGYPITNAEVEINISEIHYFPRWCVVLDENRSHDTTITVLTDEKGVFKFDFAPQKPKDSYGVFYSFDAKVLDITGETQTSSYSMFIGKSAYTLSDDVKYKYRTDDKTEVKCTVQNSQGIEQEGMKLRYEISEKQKDIWYRTSRDEAEYKSFSEAELKKWKPDLRYFKDQQTDSFAILRNGELTSGEKFDLKAILGNRAGGFRIRFSLNNEADEKVETQSDFIIWNPESKKDQHQEEFWVETLNPSPNMGEEVSIIIGSSHKKAKLYLATYNEKGLVSSKYVKLKTRKVVKLKMDETAKNGLALYASIVKDGQVSEHQVPFYPLDTTRILKLKLKSIEQPLRPGSEQTWELEITQSGENVENAEVLASMYDASLDAILGHSWQANLIPQKYIYANWSRSTERAILGQGNSWLMPSFYVENNNIMFRGGRGDYFQESEMYMDKAMAPVSFSWGYAEGTSSGSGSGGFDALGKINSADPKIDASTEEPVKSIRENFNETAFFAPKIHVNAEGNYKWSFTLPDALTKWKLMSLAHTKDLKNEYFSESFEARKELMLETFEPRFWRKGDSLIWTGKVTNLSEKEQAVEVKLSFRNPLDENDISDLFGSFENQKLVLKPNESKAVEWKLFVPENAPVLVNFEAEATTTDFSDIVRKTTPILSGTETVTMAENFTFDEKGTYQLSLTDLNKISAEAKLQSYTIQVQPQPLWGTMLSLAQLLQPSNDLNDTYFTQYFSARLAQKILSENPEMKRALKTWMEVDEDALTSLLEQNQELKSLVLAETNWLQEGQSETQRLRYLGQLLDDSKLNAFATETWSKLIKLQLPDGTWSWIGQERTNWYMTQHFANGMAWLKENNVKIDQEVFDKTMYALENYYHQRFAKLTKVDKEKGLGLSTDVLHWLYVRSFTKNAEDSATLYYAGLIAKNWKTFNLSNQAVIGLIALRKKDAAMVEKLKASFNDKARHDKKMGMYWLENTCSSYWFENNIETQVELIEFLQKAGQNPKDVRAMQMWLLQQKRTQMWESQKSTAAACTALSSFGKDDEPNANRSVTLQIPGQASIAIPFEKVTTTVKPDNINWNTVQQKVTLDISMDEPVFANMQVTYSDKAANIQKTSGDFKVERIYYKVKSGKEIKVENGENLEVGDLLRVKIKLVSNRTMDFVYIEDPKAPGWESMNALSGYQYANGPFYLSNRDSKTAFFIESLMKGTSQYEYDVKVTAKGVFNVGPAKVMCYYAPTFTANTQGEKFPVK